MLVLILPIRYRDAKAMCDHSLEDKDDVNG